jgi:diacylglycerol kinase
VLIRLINSFKFAFRGIVLVFKTEANARIHGCIAIAAIALGFALQINLTEWLIIIGWIAAVIAAEAFNTAIENTINLVSPDIHPLAGRAKDAAAGAVLILAIGAAVSGLIIFVPKLF